MKEEKQLLFDEIFQKTTTSKAFIVVKYDSFSATAANDLRASLEKDGGELEVVKKRIFLRVTQDIEGISQKLLQGHIGVVFAYENPVETTKTIYRFSQSHKNIFEVLLGVFDGKFYAPQEVELLSKLPDLEGMRAQLLTTFEAPIAQTLRAMDAVLCSVIHCMQNYAKEQK